MNMFELRKLRRDASMLMFDWYRMINKKGENQIEHIMLHT